MDISEKPRWRWIFVEIIIDERAKKYIEKKVPNNEIQILVTASGIGWGAAYEPWVKVGKPYEKTKFEFREIDNIKVYVLSGTEKMFTKLNINLKGLLFKKSLIVKYEV